METIDTIRNRRSIKEFTLDTVSHETLEGLVDLARLSPAGNNKNAWRFIVIQDRQMLECLGETHPYCGWLKKASAGIAVIIDPKATRYWPEDCSVAATTIWLAATGQGLGAAWAAMYLSDNAVETARRQKHVREALAVPKHIMVPMVLAVGYPASRPVAKNRPYLTDVVCWEGYTALSTEQAESTTT